MTVSRGWKSAPTTTSPSRSHRASWCCGWRRCCADPVLWPRPGRLVRVGTLELDQAARRATRDGAELSLTVREFDLLAFLLTHPGVAYTREQLMREVWGWSFGDQSTVTVHVRRLREKVEADPTSPRLIQTVWGVGYRLEAA